MIVRTYARRTRDIAGGSFSGSALVDHPAAAETEEGPFDFPVSQESSQDRFNFTAFSSQDSSPWSLDPFDLADADPFAPPSGGNSSSGSLRRPGRKQVRNSSRKVAEPAAAAATTSTLMEAQEFGEMMEHVDEVNFAIDGLRPRQPARIRRASLLSLLSICGTAQQRRLLRAQGMAKKIVDAILGLNFDDSSSTLAAATLFFVLASDVQDDHLLDSVPCISFLLKLLDSPSTNCIVERPPTVGSRLLGIRKPQNLSVTEKGMDSSSRTIILKVQEILSSCKEIKAGAGDEGMSRPELSSKWISLLTLERACLSTVSFEDTSETVRNARGNFKEKLRELGGLDAIFDVVVSCHSIMEKWLKCMSPSVSEVKDEETMESVVLLLKCLKILENATFLSKDNQDHLLRMTQKINSERISRSFVTVVISSIKILSGLALLRSPSKIGVKVKPIHLLENVCADINDSSQVQVNERKRGGVSCGTEGSKNITLHKRQKLSDSPPEFSDSGSEKISQLGRRIHSVKNIANDSSSAACCQILSGSKGATCTNTSGTNVNIKATGFRMNINGLKVNSDTSGKHASGWISIKTSSSVTSSCRPSNRHHVSEDEDECSIDSYDPFAFDEGELELSKWDKMARRKESSQTILSTVTDNEHERGYDDCDVGQTSSQPIDGNCQKLSEENCLSVFQEDANILEDCLLASVKVLMNLTNDNPVGCQQIASCGGLDTMVSLIVNHFPSYGLCLPLDGNLKEDTSSEPNTSINHLNKKHLTDNGLDFLVAILGLLVNLVEKDSRNRLRLASARVLVDGQGNSKIQERYMDVIPLLCSVFLANQGAGEAAGEGKLLVCDDEALMQGEQEAEMMIIEAYAALLLAFLSTESSEVRKDIASCLPNRNLEALVPVLERFLAFHLQLNMISTETHSAVKKIIESCKGS